MIKNRLKTTVDSRADPGNSQLNIGGKVVSAVVFRSGEADDFGEIYRAARTTRVWDGRPRKAQPPQPERSTGQFMQRARTFRGEFRQANVAIWRIARWE